MIIKGKKILPFAGQRIDKVLKILFPDFSRERLKAFINKPLVFVNNSSVKSSYLLKNTDVLDIKELKNKPFVIKKQDLNIEILFEDSDKLVVFKPCGVLTHMDTNYRENTLINALVDKIHLEEFEEKNRPGIVHRLDKDTSGILLVCKNLKCRDFYIEQFKKRKVEKRYYAIVFGHLKDKKGIIDSPIIRDLKTRKKMTVSSDKKAKPSITHFEVLKEFKLQNMKFALLELDLKTGRTHQLRVHLSAISHPIVGDFLYGSKKENEDLKNISKRMYLESYKISFKDNLSSEFLTFKKELSEDFKSFLSNLDECGII